MNPLRKCSWGRLARAWPPGLALLGALYCGFPAAALAAQTTDAATGCRLAPPQAHLEQQITRGGLAIARNGTPVFLYGAGRYVPASILKIATAHAALEILGHTHRFTTWVHREGGWLHLTGWGDPLLTSEEWAHMAASLARQGAFSYPLAGLAVDDFAFAPARIDGRGRSLNPYDAAPHALATNFNTLYVERTPQGELRSAEPQTPLIPLAAELARGLPPGRERINITARGDYSLRHAAELAGAFFTAQGARFAPPPPSPGQPQPLLRWQRARSPNRPPDWIHTSRHTLADAVRSMLKYSNNLIANQLVLALALHSTPKNAAGRPIHSARFRTGLRTLNQHLQTRLGLSSPGPTLVEGSGLSRRNRIRLLDMLRIVDAFHPWQHLLSLEGTGTQKVRAKTGSLRGVQSLAGFLPPLATPQGKMIRRSFVLMLNQPKPARTTIVRTLLRACL